MWSLLPKTKPLNKPDGKGAATNCLSAGHQSINQTQTVLQRTADSYALHLLEAGPMLQLRKQFKHILCIYDANSWCGRFCWASWTARCFMSRENLQVDPKTKPSSKPYWPWRQAPKLTRRLHVPICSRYFGLTAHGALGLRASSFQARRFSICPPLQALP